VQFTAWIFHDLPHVLRVGIFAGQKVFYAYRLAFACPFGAQAEAQRVCGLVARLKKRNGIIFVF
jgi:hypothetical protein